MMTTIRAGKSHKGKIACRVILKFSMKEVLKAKFFNFPDVSVFLLLFIIPFTLRSQDKQDIAQKRESIISAARELMDSARYCTLITLDQGGHPQARIMDPFSPGEDMVIWMGTNRDSRKVKEIENDQRVTLSYQAKDGSGYVVIKGKGYLVDEDPVKTVYWKEEWKQFYAGSRENYLLIKVVPLRLEIVSYRHNLTGNPVTWEAPSVDF